MTEVSQEVFRSVYRKRDSFLHRSSYMRRGKTYAIHAGLGDAGVELSGKQVFDFGFGPGNFLWSCPLDCDLAGCEIDPVHVKAFAEDLEKRGQRAVDLRVASDESDDYAAAFGGDRFDIIVMSHVLEHIPEPSEVLKAAREALNPGGCIVVILPINEKIPDPKHYHAVTAEMSRGWFEAAGLQVPVCRELGFVNYLIQLWVGKQSKIGRLVAQGLGLGLGLASGLFSPQWWWRATDCLGGKRGQIVLVGTDDLPTNESGGNTSAPDKPVSKPKKIFVTGGSGFIGTNLVSELESRGLEICNYDHSAPNIEDHKKYWTEGDLLDVSLMAKTVREFAPDCVVHLGARADCDENTTVEKGYQANTTGVANFLEAMKGCPGIERIIVTSTQYVCGPSRQPEHDEDFFPHTIYGQSKVETEKLTRAAGLESTWTIIRPVNIWGPYHARYCREFWKVAAKGWYVHPNVPAPTRTYGYIGQCHLADHGSPGRQEGRRPRASLLCR